MYRDSFQAKHSQGQHDGAHLWELWRMPAGSLSLFLSPKWNKWVIHKDCTSDSAKEAEVERHPIGSNQQATPDTVMQCQLATKMNFKEWGLHLKLSWPSLFKEEAQQFYLHPSALYLKLTRVDNALHFRLMWPHSMPFGTLSFWSCSQSSARSFSAMLAPPSATDAHTHKIR